MSVGFFTQFQKLHETGNPFAIATVIRAEKPTSAKVGAKAVIAEDGKLSGWIGGSCAEPTVRREAKKALQDGQPRFIRLCPLEKMGQAPRDEDILVAALQSEAPYVALIASKKRSEAILQYCMKPI